MPQVWLTYQEIAEEVRYTVREVEKATLAAGWQTQGFPDGVVRVSLPPVLMQAYMKKLAATNTVVTFQRRDFETQLRMVLGQHLMHEW